MILIKAVRLRRFGHTDWFLLTHSALRATAVLEYIHAFTRIESFRADASSLRAPDTGTSQLAVMFINYPMHMLAPARAIRRPVSSRVLLLFLILGDVSLARQMRVRCHARDWQAVRYMRPHKYNRDQARLSNCRESNCASFCPSCYSIVQVSRNSSTTETQFSCQFFVSILPALAARRYLRKVRKYKYKRRGKDEDT